MQELRYKSNNFGYYYCHVAFERAGLFLLLSSFCFACVYCRRQ